VPALAVADVLRARGFEVAFGGTRQGMEARLVPRSGYPFHVVRIRGFERHLGLTTLRTLGSLPVAAIDATRVLRRLQPSCVLGFGGYVAGPLVALAALFGLPTVAVEMDAHMGWTNRLLSRVVDKVCLSFPDPLKRGGKYIFTGRPLRPGLLAVTREEGIRRFGLDPERPVVLIFGGSLGARTINRAAVAAFAKTVTSFQILHVAGHRDYDEVCQALRGPGANPSYQVHAFLDDFPLALAAADAVVSRAGGSVAEILARGLPSLLVPYPFAAGDHQARNAERVVAQGAALTLSDADLDAKRLTEAVETLLDPPTNQRMREAALKLARPDAADRIAEVVVELVAASGRKVAGPGEAGGPGATSKEG
jgi:UDP-N-acetylglucosamine--N-acetylmuramyl-(pentapeptide) pyrophosphoryl-undecaprenol N-acetylglucosamine transferase